MKKIFTTCALILLGIVGTWAQGAFDGDRNTRNWIVSAEGNLKARYVHDGDDAASESDIYLGYLEIITDTAAYLDAAFINGDTTMNYWHGAELHQTTYFHPYYQHYYRLFYLYFDGTNLPENPTDTFAATIQVTRDGTETLTYTVKTVVGPTLPYLRTDLSVIDFGDVLPDDILDTYLNLNVYYHKLDEVSLFSHNYEIALSDNYFFGSRFSSDKNVDSTFIFINNYDIGQHYDTLELVGLAGTYGKHFSLKLPVHYNIVDTTLRPKPVLLPHLYSVSPTKQVQFTRGNLYWSGKEWRLEREQTDHTEAWNTFHVDHLKWTRTAEASYALDFNETDLSIDDHLFCDGSDAAHMLTIEGENDLYCLSMDEWRYLADQRCGGYYGAVAHWRFPVSVAGVDSCVVFSPDDYTGTIAESYTAEEFALTEADGLVCLPPMQRMDETYPYGRMTPTYWSATPYVRQTLAGNYQTARNFFFYTNNGQSHFNEVDNDMRYTGLGIRLARESRTLRHKIMVKVPNCTDEVPAIVFPGETADQYEVMTPTSDGWYVYNLEVPNTHTIGAFYFVEQNRYKFTRNYLRTVSGQQKVLGSYDCAISETIMLDLSDESEYEWVECQQRLSDTARIEEAHFYIPKPEVGNRIPTMCFAEFTLSNGTFRTDSLALTWSKTDSIYEAGKSYYTYPGYSEIRRNGNYYDNTPYYWHIGGQVTKLDTYFSPSFTLGGIEIVRNLSPVTLRPEETCTLEYEIALDPTCTPERFTWYIDGHSVYASDGFTINSTESVSTLSFPATLLPTGVHEVYCGFIYKESTGTRKGKYTTTVNVTVMEGNAISPAETGIISEDHFSSTIYIEDYSTIGSTETGIVIHTEDATIVVTGTSHITATETGIETAEDFIIEGDEDAAAGSTMTISAPKPIYTPREGIRLTVYKITMNLDCYSSAAAAPHRMAAHMAYMAPRMALEDGVDHSVISGFEELVLEGCTIVYPAGAYYSETLRELVEADGTTLVKHAIIVADGAEIPSLPTDLCGTQSTDTDVRKLLRDGHLYIRKGNHLYNVLGTKIE